VINFRLLTFTMVLVVFSNPVFARGSNFPDFTQLVEDVAPAVVTSQRAVRQNKTPEKTFSMSYFDVIDLQNSKKILRLHKVLKGLVLSFLTKAMF